MVKGNGLGEEQTSPVMIDHVAFAVTDMAQARHLLEAGFGLVELRERRVEGPELQVSILAAEHLSVELLALPADTAPPMHLMTPHLAFRVADLQEARHRLLALGVRWQDDEPMRVGDTLNVWSDPETSAGLVIQLVSPL